MKNVVNVVSLCELEKGLFFGRSKEVTVVVIVVGMLIFSFHSDHAQVDGLCVVVVIVIVGTEQGGNAKNAHAGPGRGLIDPVSFDGEEDVAGHFARGHALGRFLEFPLLQVPKGGVIGLDGVGEAATLVFGRLRGMAGGGKEKGGEGTRGGVFGVVEEGVFVGTVGTAQVELERLDLDGTGGNDNAGALEQLVHVMGLDGAQRCHFQVSREEYLNVGWVVWVGGVVIFGVALINESLKRILRSSFHGGQDLSRLFEQVSQHAGIVFSQVSQVDRESGSRVMTVIVSVVHAKEHFAVHSNVVVLVVRVVVAQEFTKVALDRVQVQLVLRLWMGRDRGRKSSSSSSSCGGSWLDQLLVRVVQASFVKVHGRGDVFTVATTSRLVVEGVKCGMGMNDSADATRTTGCSWFMFLLVSGCLAEFEFSGGLGSYYAPHVHSLA